MRMHQKTVLQKAALLVRAGMMEPPKWYAAIKQVPPFHRRPSDGIETLKLPWDALAQDFASKNPHMVEDSEWLGPNGYKPGAPPISYVFAKRQYALMQNGFKKDEAYKRTHDAMKAERAADLATIRRRVKEASVLAGARPSFVADDDVYSGLRYWQTMMNETPYTDWDLAAKQALGVFLRREVLGWDDEQMKFAQSAKDGTAEALEAEIKRLRVSLFPETKTKDYAFPSDVVRPWGEEKEQGAAKEDEEFDELVEIPGEEKEEWKSPLLDADWKDSLRRFQEMAKEVSYELDWSPDDRQHLNSFLVGRCIRRSVLEEAFAWIPDPVAEALTKIGADTEDATAEYDAADQDLDHDHIDGDDRIGVSGAAVADADGANAEVEAGPAAEGVGEEVLGHQQQEEGEESEEDDQEENWMAGEELEGFKGDWMGVARRRAGKVQTTLAIRVRKGKGKGKGAVAAAETELEKNLKAVLIQAKRQLFPDLVLEEDEQGGKESVEDRRARIAAKKKIMLADLEWENEEVEAEREVMISKLKAGVGPPKNDSLEEVRKKRLSKGTWKAERRRLLKLEKELYEKQQSGHHNETEDGESGEERLASVPDSVVESEILRAKAREFYAKEKARMKRSAKLWADAAAAGKEAKANIREEAGSER